MKGYIGLSLALLVGTCSRAREPGIDSTTAALTSAQCTYFASGGKVRVCHATGSKRTPYTILSVKVSGCIDGHAQHVGDYVAANDPTCSGNGHLPAGAPCDPTLRCMEGYSCQAGTCQATDRCAGVSCTANGPCDFATCDPTSGQCVHEPTTGNACSDGNACTQTDVCQAGSCVGTNSSGTCTACNAATYPGADRFAFDASSATCYASYDDEVTSFTAAQAACLGAGGHLATITSAAEAAVIGQVQNTLQNPWIGGIDDGNDTDAVFAWVTGQPWSFSKFAPGQPDDDAAVGGNGECLHILDASGAWNDTSCDAVGFVVGRICEFPPLATPADCANPGSEGATCSDGNGCTQTDTCHAGRCVGSNPVTCTASDQCHVPGTCDPGTGGCSNPTASDGTTCSDGNACTRTDVCQAGGCIGANPVTCTASDQCQVAGTCDPRTGGCSNPNASDGTTCSDGNACTRTDVCQAGNCVGTNPSDACTACNASAYPGADRFAFDTSSATCYASYDDEPSTFAAARAACQAAGGHLVTITSAGEAAVVAEVQNNAQNPWIGAIDDGNDTDAVFGWVSGEPWGFSQFAPGQPDDDAGLGGSGECLHIQDASGAWNDTNCDAVGFVVGRICEFPQGPLKR